MAEDREVLREVWQGRIPTAFKLASEDVSSMAPETFYLMLPRMSYLALTTEKVKKYFSKFVTIDQVSDDIWFDFEGNPLRLHLPIGVLYDQLKLDGLNAGAVGPPWNLTVHFGNFPDKEILKCDTKEAVESNFMSSVKEADQFKHGGRVMSTMQKKDHNQLWQGLLNDKFDQFWAVNRRLMEVTLNASQGARSSTPPAPSGSSTSLEASSDQAANAGLKTFKHIPVRVYKSDQILFQKLVKPVKPCDNGMERLTSLQDLVNVYFPDIEVNKVKVMTQGIEPDFDTPIQWMAEHLSYPDNFLHIIVFLV